MKDGQPFRINAFRKTPWSGALKWAEVDYRKTYAMRHSFAAWALTIGMNPDKLVHLMGHGSKEMVYIQLIATPEKYVNTETYANITSTLLVFCP